MKIWQRLFKPKIEDYSISSRHRFLMGPTAAGKTVTEQSAMQLTAVYTCVSDPIIVLLIHFVEPNYNRLVLPLIVQQ